MLRRFHRSFSPSRTGSDPCEPREPQGVALEVDTKPIEMIVKEYAEAVRRFSPDVQQTMDRGRQKPVDGAGTSSCLFPEPIASLTDTVAGRLCALRANHLGPSPRRRSGMAGSGRGSDRFNVLSDVLFALRDTSLGRRPRRDVSADLPGFGGAGYLPDRVRGLLVSVATTAHAVI